MVFNMIVPYTTQSMSICFPGSGNRTVAQQCKTSNPDISTSRVDSRLTISLDPDPNKRIIGTY